MLVGMQIFLVICGIVFGGGCYNGGVVNGGKFYRVGECGVLELFIFIGGKQYMILGEGG